MKVSHLDRVLASMLDSYTAAMGAPQSHQADLSCLTMPLSCSGNLTAQVQISLWKLGQGSMLGQFSGYNHLATVFEK